jgi:hypothetical protein
MEKWEGKNLIRFEKVRRKKMDKVKKREIVKGRRIGRN